ncbi:MAG: DUF4411 family protein [Ectothiorhodospiraceae bacterium AqS1]|nr:DUF4411 family protein [Ectothiorhodospiraceae bacterium AqS1]
MKYLLDANVFIAANNLHYGLDFCPAFWDWLIESNHRKAVYSIEKVGDEIDAGEGQLSQWAQKLGNRFFLDPDAKVLKAMTKVSEQVKSYGYTSAAINDFPMVADYWLVSHALAYQLVVVTHEKPADTPNKVKISNICARLNIKVMTPFEMLRHERARFVLGVA